MKSFRLQKKIDMFKKILTKNNNTNHYNSDFIKSDMCQGLNIEPHHRDKAIIFKRKKNRIFQTFNENKMHNVYINKVENIDWNKIRPRRAGVIVYYDNPETKERNFCLGIDRVYNEITDFSGGISYKNDKTALVGALREFNEESLGVFGKIKQDIILKSLVVYNYTTMVIFINFESICPNEITTNFNNRVTKNSEVSSLIWLAESEFKNLIIHNKNNNNNKMYDRIRLLLESANKLKFLNFL